jgi:hypothetical protein
MIEAIRTEVRAAEPAEAVRSLQQRRRDGREPLVSRRRKAKA